MTVIILDTSVIIEYFRTKTGLFLALDSAFQKRTITIAIPSIVILELWKGSSMNNDSVAKRTENFIQQYQHVALSDEIAKFAGKIERDGHSRGYDAIIAATCLAHHAHLATLNSKDFAHVPGLTLWKP